MPFKSRLMQPSKFEKVANNLDALDLELSQTKKLYELIEGHGHGNSHRDMHRVVGGELMESLDLQTGYKGVMQKREERLA